MPSDPKPLTPKQTLFVAEYLVDLNATAAAERAGYRWPAKMGPRLVGESRIAEAIRAAQQERSKRVKVSQDWVVIHLVQNVERSMQVEPVLNATGEVTGEYTYQGSVANKALELLGKHIGMWPSKPEQPADVTVKITLEMALVARQELAEWTAKRPAS